MRSAPATAARGGSRPPGGRLLRWWHLHPRIPMAVRAAVAAVLAWLVAQQVPEPFATYPYFAPLGAVIATTTTLVRGLRESAQAVAAIAAGALLAAAVDTLLEPGLVAIAAVVLVGTLVSGLRLFGSSASWVVTAALFVLIIGQTDPDGYAVAYLGMVALGAVIGVAVSAVLPPLPLTVTGRDLDRLRGVLASQLRELADGLRRHDLPGSREWDGRRHAVEAALHEARTTIGQSGQAARWNWSARANRGWMREQDEDLRRLETAAATVFDVTRLVLDGERAETTPPVLPGLRSLAVDAIEGFADALDGNDGGTDHLAVALDRFGRGVREARDAGTLAHLGAGAMVLSLERGARALLPDDERDPGT